MENIKLDLMDWKSIEETAERQIREALAIIVIGEKARTEAKKMIKSYDGKTSEEERAEGKKKINQS